MTQCSQSKFQTHKHNMFLKQVKHARSIWKSCSCTTPTKSGFKLPNSPIQTGSNQCGAVSSYHTRIWPSPCVPCPGLTWRESPLQCMTFGATTLLLRSQWKRFTCSCSCFAGIIERASLTWLTLLRDAQAQHKTLGGMWTHSQAFHIKRHGHRQRTA